MVMVPGTTQDQRVALLQMIEDLFKLPEGKTISDVWQEAKQEAMDQATAIVNNNHQILSNNLQQHSNMLLSMYQRAQEELALLRMLEANVLADPATEENVNNIHKLVAELKQLRTSWLPEVDPATVVS